MKLATVYNYMLPSTPSQPQSMSEHRSSINQPQQLSVQDGFLLNLVLSNCHEVLTELFAQNSV